MNSRDQAHAEDRKALKSMERRPWLVAALAVLAIIASTGIVFGIINQQNTDQLQTLTNQNRTLTSQAQAAADKAQAAAEQARQQALASCLLYERIADAPLSPQTSAYGLQIAVAVRVAYQSALCALGPLTSPDPRVAKLLPPGVK